MEQLGIEPGLLLAQIINFSIIVIVLTKVLYKPILKTLDERKRKIEEGLALTETLQKQEEKLKEKENKVLERARKDAQIIFEDAQKKGKEKQFEIVHAAKEEASEIVRKGKEEASRQKEAMQDDIRREAVELAVAMSKRLLSQILTERQQHDVLSTHIKQIEKIRS